MRKPLAAVLLVAGLEGILGGAASPYSNDLPGSFDASRMGRDVDVHVTDKAGNVRVLTPEDRSNAPNKGPGNHHWKDRPHFGANSSRSVARRCLAYGSLLHACASSSITAPTSDFGFQSV